MTRQAEDTRRANQAEFWNDKQARARTPEQRAAVWYDACRMTIRNARPSDQPRMWEALASHLHSFFQVTQGDESSSSPAVKAG